MKKNILIVYSIEILLLVILCLALFVSNIFDKNVLALLLALFAFITTKLVKKKNIKSYFSKGATLLMLGFAVIYLIAFYLMGIYFGFYEASAKFNFYTIYTFIIPLSVIIVSSEIIRDRLLSYKGKMSRALVLINMILVDLIVYTGVYDLNRLDDLLTVVGFIFFASVACNLLYNYMCVRFGKRAIIIYRLITVLYIYIIPYIPNVYLFFRSFLRMIYPYIIYLTLEYTYSGANKVSTYGDRTKNAIGTAVVIVIMSLIIALVSCRFAYGILVVGSGSMTGTINMGDAIIFKQYKQQIISEGDIILFNKGDIRTVHRVVSVENVNGEYRYYTKGDANQQIDDGYRTKKDIIGVSKVRIAYLGYPTLWIRDIFETND